MKPLISKIMRLKTRLQNLTVRYEPAVGFILLVVSLGSQAADITVANSKMKVSININGELLPGDGDRFSLITKNIPKATVILNSNGGDLVSGIQIGTIIREKGYATLVLAKNTCASSCGLIWFSGAPRYLSNDVFVGFHSAYTIENGEALETGVGNAIVGAYLTKLGASYETIIFFTEASPDEINWLTPKIAHKLNISFADSDNGQYNPEKESLQIVTKYKSLNGIEKKAVSIVNSYFQMMMQDRESSRYYLQSILDSNVISNNVFRNKSDIITARLADFHKWKSRSIEVIPESLNIYCDGINSCEVTGNFSWIGITSFYEHGLGNFAFYIDFTNVKPRIFGDTISFN